MPYSKLQTSPLVPGISPVKIYYRETGPAGDRQASTASAQTARENRRLRVQNLDTGSLQSERKPLLLLHGGWGYEIYPFARQIDALHNYRILAPDRSGYGRSTRLVTTLPSDFHYHAATETLSFMDSLGIDRAFFWGHSDGAVIAAIIGFTAPERVNGLILEAFHYYRRKPASQEFFETLAN